MPPADFDTRMMAIALTMARRGLGSTAPNPAVGAVIADETTGDVIARGWTQPGGRPHAEKEALVRAGERARGKTMYVTLEPCAHTGRVPTCADAVVTSGIARVVCALPDPNRVVAGHGFAQLREAGIAVDVGRLGGRARWITLGHILRQTEGRPFVQLKMALGADGRIARGDGKPVWVTGEQARADGHLLRAEADAILVGGMTVRADDPELTCRLPGLGQRSPIRIVFSPKLGLPLDRKLVAAAATQPVWLVTGAPSGRADAEISARGVQIVHVPEALMGVAGMAAVMRTLAVKGITRLLVEGGPRTWAACLEARLVDEVVVYQGPEPAPVNGLDVFPNGGMEAYFSLFGLVRAESERLGADVRLVYRRVGA
jgi:diaminohydroxyphosphoribosylaminopyrimidine deaminase / 5-amino-6-(5-phosphoribosylamino)uracil reductase